jgi:hypothetical protein
MSRPQPLPTRRTIRRQQLREIVPLADATAYDMERLVSGMLLSDVPLRCVGSRQSRGLGRNATRGLQSESHQSRAVA